jgi:AraC family transcriptional activator of pobA
MPKTETLQDFYERHPAANPAKLALNNANGLGHFNVYSRNACSHITPYNRRDFYKISLVVGTGKLYYADKWIDINKPALLFSNPLIPYSWEPISEKQDGYFCLFTEAFINTTERKESLQHSPLFKPGGSPVFFINTVQRKFLSDVFLTMLTEMNSDYMHKYDLLRNYVHIILHEAQKIQPAESYEKHSNASSRITSLFMELLERQFPIDSPEHVLQLKTATDYANSLSVHVNHLNRSVKEITGKTTTEQIAGRIVIEAKALLQHTDWNVAEIAYSLGFEYPAYFNNFFKKQTDTTPLSLRN